MSKTARASNEQTTKIDRIRAAIDNIKIAPYQEVKKNLDSAARKTRRALGVKRRASCK
ncbi:MAG: hypothetical protein LBQ52_02945 [Helicobacteraceae bacterium]|jgi:hypothetical protein|nr:hypothetical protein [Helicobacteraceae bacterium]